MQRIQVLAAAGAVLLLVGVFAPVLSMGLGEPVSYYDHARPEAITILVLAAMTGAMAYARQYAAFWFTGIGSAAMLVFSATQVRERIAGVGRADGVFGKALRALSDMAMDSVRYEWGWALLAAGAALVLLAAALAPARR